MSDNAGIDTGTLNTWCVHVVRRRRRPTFRTTSIVPARCVLRGVSPEPVQPDDVGDLRSARARGHVSLRVYDVSGRLVRTLVDGEKGAGYHTAVWDGRDDAGTEVASGVYFCRMEAEAFTPRPRWCFSSRRRLSRSVPARTQSPLIGTPRFTARGALFLVRDQWSDESPFLSNGEDYGILAVARVQPGQELRAGRTGACPKTRASRVSTRRRGRAR